MAIKIITDKDFNPVDKTNEMTQPVGVDGEGKMWTNPTSGNGDGTGGKDGKSAYEYAKDAGYTGTEAEFAQKLAQEPLFGTTAKITPSQVRDAVIINRPIGITYTDSPFGAFHFTSFDTNVSLNAVFASSILQYNGMYAVVELIGDFSADTWQLVIEQIPIMSDVPTDDYINALIDEKLGVIENGSY